jgi:hypothetical protein
MRGCTGRSKNAEIIISGATHFSSTLLGNSGGKSGERNKRKQQERNGKKLVDFNARRFLIPVIL